MRTDDGLHIAASYVPSQNRAAIVVFPGRSGDHVASCTSGCSFQHGYGALVLDERGHGASDGDPNLLGWSGENDIRAAISSFNTRDVDASRIGGLGLSVGGEVMLQTAARNEGLRAVVSEGAGSRWVGDDLHTAFPAQPRTDPVHVGCNTATAVVPSDSLPPPAARSPDSADRTTPIMLIWTPKGIGGEWFNPRYFDLAGAPKTIWEIPESAHTDGLATRPAEYEVRVHHVLRRHARCHGWSIQLRSTDRVVRPRLCFRI